MKGKVISVNISNKKGVSKSPVKEIILEKGYGVKGDVHGGTELREVSLLAVESIEKIKKEEPRPKGGVSSQRGKFIQMSPFIPAQEAGYLRRLPDKNLNLKPGDFAENITFSGINPHGINPQSISVGDILKIGEAELEISQIGKECHTGCEIFKKVGDCVMPREGLFARVIKGGKITAGMDVEVKSYK